MVNKNYALNFSPVCEYCWEVASTPHVKLIQDQG